MLDWSRYAIFWGVFPLGFTGAENVLEDPDQAPTHRLPRLLGWLDHLVELGCNGLLLNPLFASMSHGYDTLDYFRVDPRIGDLDDFDAVVTACHERGIRVVLDGVFNHVGRSYPGLDALTTGDVFEGEQQLVVLDHGDAVVQQLVRDVMTFWLGRGVDGWRLDAAYAVPPEFWTHVIPAVREQFHDAWFLGEMIHGDYVAYAEAAGLDSITQYELWKAMWSSIENHNFFELDHTLGRHAELLARGLVPFTFLDNHDTTRVASQIADDRHWGHAIALLLFLPGIPCLYYGDELGVAGVKEERLGGDDAIRPTMPSSPSELSDVNGAVLELYRRLIAFRRRTAWLTDAVITTSDVSNTYLRITATPVSADDGAPLTLVLNLADEPAGLPDDNPLVEGSHPDEKNHVAAHGWAITRADG